MLLLLVLLMVPMLVHLLCLLQATLRVVLEALHLLLPVVRTTRGGEEGVAEAVGGIAGMAAVGITIVREMANAEGDAAVVEEEAEGLYKPRPT